MCFPAWSQEMCVAAQCATVDSMPPCSIVVSRGVDMCRDSSLAIDYARSIGAVASGALGLRYGVSRFVEPSLCTSSCIVRSICKV